jgi:hypothetical protein
MVKGSDILLVLVSCLEFIVIIIILMVKVAIIFPPAAAACVRFFAKHSRVATDRL